MFTKAIVRKPGRSVVHGITTAGLGKVDFQLVCRQHDAYISALKGCGLEVIVLDAQERFPDSVFMEDVALLTPKCAIITRPGAESRQGEELLIKSTLEQYYDNLALIKSAGMVEAGDIMMAGNHFFIGLSERTNQEGAKQLFAILERYGHTGSTVRLQDLLHLKTGCSYLENNTMVVIPAMAQKPEFSGYDKIVVDEDESYAANCVWINGTVLIPSGNPKLEAKVINKGYQVIELEMSEFRKLDGGLSCLSLRF